MFSVSEAFCSLPVYGRRRALNRDKSILNFFLYPIYSVETNGFAIREEIFVGQAFQPAGMRPSGTGSLERLPHTPYIHQGCVSPLGEVEPPGMRSQAGAWERDRESSCSNEMALPGKPAVARTSQPVISFQNCYTIAPNVCTELVISCATMLVCGKSNL